ncbi:MAG: hypothetical protein FJ217_07975 [Ignavibacteria bacterium]|nr:hypothetical protein [Ignavibacteria bacterium]
MTTEPKFTIPRERFYDFLVSALCDMNAKLLVLIEAAKHLHVQIYQESEQATKTYFDDLYDWARTESQTQYFAKYGGESRDSSSQ